MIVNIADFRNNMAEYLRHIEENIYLTRHGKVVGVVCRPGGEEKITPPDEVEICLHEIDLQLERLGNILREDKKKANEKSGS